MIQYRHSVLFGIESILSVHSLMLIRTRSQETSISNCSFAGSHGTHHKALESEQDEASEKVANADADAGVSADSDAGRNTISDACID